MERFDHLCYFLIYFLEREGGREAEKHQSVASRTPPAGDLAYNPGMCPDLELNQQPFSLQTGAQSTEPHQPGQQLTLFLSEFYSIHIEQHG